jgi:hypothetical protein
MGFLAFLRRLLSGDHDNACADEAARRRRLEEIRTLLAEIAAPCDGL